MATLCAMLNGMLRAAEAEEPCVARPTRLHRLIRSDGWTCKLYGISYGKPAVDDRLLADAGGAAAGVLPDSDRPDVFGVGFVIAHQCPHADWVPVDWWQSGGVLAQHLLSRPGGSLEPLTDAAPHLLACGWELHLDGYLAAALTT